MMNYYFLFLMLQGGAYINEGEMSNFVPMCRKTKIPFPDLPSYFLYEEHSIYHSMPLARIRTGGAENNPPPPAIVR